MRAWMLLAAAGMLAACAQARADGAAGPVGGPAQTLEIPTPRGEQWLIVSAPDEAVSGAWRVNSDLADKAGRVPGPTAGYAVSGRVVVQLAGPDGSARGALAGLGGRRVNGAPGFRVIEAGSVRAAAQVARRLRGMPGVADAYVELWRPMVQRTLPTDPFFFRQWHLRNGALPIADANLEAAWALGYTGAGVTIGITEFGWQYDHPDLAANFNPEATQEWLDAPDAHATACAGVAGAVADNGLGGAGAAHGAKLSAQVTGSDVDNAAAFGFRNDLNDIKNNSWGPPDTGFIAFMSPIELAAIRDAVLTGRDGRGVVFVWAAGNGGTRDRVEYDPYASSRYTIAVGAVGDQDRRASYNESGSSMFVVAHSDGNTRKIYTTDLVGEEGYSTTDYTDIFGGTSSAAPLAAGCIALALQANPQLTWRDVQHLLVHSARKCDPTQAAWAVNGAGHDINYNYGFGAVDAGALVTLAQAWPGAGPEAEVATAVQPVAMTIPDNQPAGITRSVSVPDDLVIESVELVLNVTHAYVGDLRIVLTGPSGTQSILAEQRADPTDHYNGYVFTTFRHWDEHAAGEWTVNISDRAAVTTGTWNDWKLVFHGTRGSFCRADYNHDGVVDGEDYTLFLGYYGTGAAEADLNGDGEVDFGDYLDFLNLYDGGC
ncbi:MAG: S8 family serine peptidase [Phycisphaerales bacterium]|nr:S8 family serine peptidase [Phycisphaerales bacterium]